MHIQGDELSDTQRLCPGWGLRCTQNTDLTSQSMQPIAHPLQPAARRELRRGPAGAQPSGTLTPAWAGPRRDSSFPRMGPTPPQLRPRPRPVHLQSMPHPGGCMGHGTGGADQAAWDLPGLAGGRLHAALPTPHSLEQPLCSPHVGQSAQLARGPEKCAPVRGCSLNTQVQGDASHCDW